ncbi:S-adenosyl-L-methionine-dependent methyltransferase [Trametes gibbosa]|nr:S-adenosyl-L-methionine-dependent methyltransferase [Trametes gibbosa]
MSKRPNAWDVSFPGEEAGAAAALNPARAATPDAAPYRPPGRRGTSAHAARGSSAGSEHTPPPSKRIKPVHPEERRGALPAPKRAYVPKPEDVKEDVDTIIFGEDPIDQPDAAKPVRALSNFVVFDPTRGFEHIPIDLLDEPAASKHSFEAAGDVMPLFLNEEDEGQEDGLDGEDSGTEPQAQRIRTSAIFRWSLDYTKVNDPVYIETQYSWFELRRPADSYSRLHGKFYRPNRIAQILISSAIENPGATLDEFAEANYGEWDAMLGEYIKEEDVQEAMPTFRMALDCCEPDLRQRISAVRFVAELLRRQPTPYSQIVIPRTQVRPPLAVNMESPTCNLDVLVLRPERQNPTHVSGLVDSLALGLFHEHLKVVGPPPKHPIKHALKRQRGAMHLALAKLANRCTEEKVTVAFPAVRRLHDQFWSAVIIDGVTYEVGDCVIVQANKYRTRAPQELPRNLVDLPENAIIADYFWFAKIIYINQHKKMLHVQWFEHSSKTFLDEVSDPHELFLWPTCNDIDAKIVLGKAIIHNTPLLEDLGPMEYFCRFVYHEIDGSFQDVDHKTFQTLHALTPPENCPTCFLQEQHSEALTCIINKGALHFGGHTYHQDEYVLYGSAQGPACIGRVISIEGPKDTRAPDDVTLKIALLGRVSDVLPLSLAFAHAMVNERELFSTKQTVQIKAQALLKPCVVVHPTDVEDLPAWLALSPLNFFLQYQLHSLDASWSTKKALKRKHVPACNICLEQHNLKFQHLADMKTSCLRTFDPFAGAGAFALAMEELGSIKLTHAVELAPSAAQTLQKNSPDTVVFNQCSNLVFQYAVKYHAGNLSSSDMLHNLHDHSPLDKPPGPEDIDCIIAGFPCQPHSQLNMFRKANDRKTHLMLNLLSWVDFLKPKYCFFENVRGFLNCGLHAKQAGKYRVEGGIKMGGLKFFTRALLAMGYQVRFGLLQAAHYGTPQARVRFFLVAAIQGYPLPQLPQPTHDFPHKDALEIKFSAELPPIQPILTLNGTAPFKFVSIVDAIGDLPEFDWKDPQKILPRHADSARQGMLTFECDSHHQPCGLSGPCPSESVTYRFNQPCNSFQARCRIRPTCDLQHITRIQPSATVERVVNIPLVPGMDYRELNPRLWEWQSAHPLSAMARDGFRPGMYGRLDQNKWFHTTVTNVEPTAKQSYVIHPWCKRVFTVRELARSQGFPDWFVFYAVDGNVKTFQRHIGNAVPWPVSVALAHELREALLKKYLQDQEDAIIID